MRRRQEVLADNTAMKNSSTGQSGLRFFGVFTTPLVSRRVTGSTLPAVPKLTPVLGETERLRSKDFPRLPSAFSFSPWTPEDQQTPSTEGLIHPPARPGGRPGRKALLFLTRCSGAFAGDPVRRSHLCSAEPCGMNTCPEPSRQFGAAGDVLGCSVIPLLISFWVKITTISRLIVLVMRAILPAPPAP